MIYKVRPNCRIICFFSQNPKIRADHHRRVSPTTEASKSPTNKESSASVKAARGAEAAVLPGASRAKARIPWPRCPHQSTITIPAGPCCSAAATARGQRAERCLGKGNSYLEAKDTESGPRGVLQLAVCTCAPVGGPNHAAHVPHLQCNTASDGALSSFPPRPSLRMVGFADEPSPLLALLYHRCRVV